MAAVAEREQSEHEFVGQVFSKASPILTWRPVKVQRITLSPPAPDGASDASMVRVSRAPTKRMVAWPVVRSIGGRAGRARLVRLGERGRAVRALLVLVSLSLLCGTVLAACIYFTLGEGSVATVWHPKTPSTRAAVLHVAKVSTDVLASAPVAPIAVATPAAAPLRPVAPAPPHRGRAHRGYRGTESASAMHQPAAGTRAPHGTT